MEDLTKKLSSAEINNLNNEKLIEICHYNKKHFKKYENVEIFVNIKNISSLTIKIFEINAENYYKKNNK